jgi:nicotinamidase-related amidase
MNGSVPDSSAVALLLIDVINDLEFPNNRPLLKQTPRLARKIADLKARACKARVPVIYVNDNFGRWQSDFAKQVEHCLQDGACGRSLVEQLRPEPHDYFVLKPMHSGFFSTTLETVLRHLRAQTLILTGIAGDRCVLFTANDAFMRNFDLFIPSDCVISNTPAQNQQALKLMNRVLQADIRPSTQIDFARLRRRHPRVR